MLELYAGLFHDPEAAVEEYVALVEDELRHQLAISLLFIAGLGGLSLYAITELLPRRKNEERPSDRVRLAVAGVLVLGMTTGVGWANLLGSEGGRGPTAGQYRLPVLDDTIAEGGTTDSAVIRALLGGALEKAKQLVDRQEEQEESFRDTALAELAGLADEMEGPRTGEVAVVMQSDMHCNTTMIRVQREVVAMLSRAVRQRGRPSRPCSGSPATSPPTAPQPRAPACATRPPSPATRPWPRSPATTRRASAWSRWPTRA